MFELVRDRVVAGATLVALGATAGCGGSSHEDQPPIKTVHGPCDGAKHISGENGPQMVCYKPNERIVVASFKSGKVILRESCVDPNAPEGTPGTTLRVEQETFNSKPVDVPEYQEGTKVCADKNESWQDHRGDEGAIA